MIPELDFKNISSSLGVPLTNIEKDYVMGWLLWGVSQDSFLRERLLLKGGSALRKLYFPDTRFSDDLDFTLRRPISIDDFKSRILNIQEMVHRASGIGFETNETRVEEKEITDKDAQAIDARVYFRGFAGDSSLKLRVKFDISSFERIVLPIQSHQILHPFSDVSACAASVNAYSLEEILAEKLRSWIQRTRPRDLFDVTKIITSGLLPISKRNILSAFLQKTIFKNIPHVGKEELLEQHKFITVSDSWLTTIICPPYAMIALSNAVTTFVQFVNALFEPQVLSEITSRMPLAGFLRRIPSAVRETIIAAGRSRQLIRMTYSNAERTVEPYSFRFKIRKSDNRGFEYFYGYDRTRGEQIKCYFLNEVQGVSILPQHFQPRYVVEF